MYGVSLFCLKYVAFKTAFVPKLHHGRHEFRDKFIILFSGEEPDSGFQRSNNYICIEYGGLMHFQHSYGLRLWNHDDVEEAIAIATAMRAPGRARGQT